MTRFLLVAVGGAAGACARYGVALAVSAFWRREFPLATFLVNVTGCFVLGFVSAVAAGRVDPAWRLLVGTGFVGAYTTFSAFEYETERLADTGAITWSVVNVVASVVVGFVAVRLGILLGRR
ncbi:MAG TPA: fluoride efflux transporter CrcB [Thermoanaerobaculia bacterium]|nr:fluoride efflux transporter CrcB [Thermoanaerobaculia bacterium]